MDNGRRSAAMNGIVRKTFLPDYLAGGGQTGRAQVSEMNEKTVAIIKRSGAGMTVLFVYAGGIVMLEQDHAPLFLSADGIKGKNLQGKSPFLFDRIG